MMKLKLRPRKPMMIKMNEGHKNENSIRLKAKIAAVRVRGLAGINRGINDTMDMLKLFRKNFCVVLENAPSNVGMLKKAKDYITYGEMDDETYKLLIEKRSIPYKGPETDSSGKIKYNKFNLVDGKKIKKYFKLNSPKKGYGRKGVKKTFKQGGALGYRGDKINDLLRRMI